MHCSNESEFIVGIIERGLTRWRMFFSTLKFGTTGNDGIHLLAREVRSSSRSLSANLNSSRGGLFLELPIMPSFEGFDKNP